MTSTDSDSQGLGAAELASWVPRGPKSGTEWKRAHIVLISRGWLPQASARLITASRLCALDDSVHGPRNEAWLGIGVTVTGLPSCFFLKDWLQRNLGSSIRAFVIFGPPEKKCSAWCSTALKDIDFEIFDTDETQRWRRKPQKKLRGLPKRSDQRGQGQTRVTRATRKSVRESG